MQCAEGSLIITYPYHGGVLFATFSLEKSYGCMLVSSNIIRVQCTLGWIHVGASGRCSLRDEYTSGSYCSLRSRSQAFGLRPSACRRWATGLYYKLHLASWIAGVSKNPITLGIVHMMSWFSLKYIWENWTNKKLIVQFLNEKRTNESWKRAAAPVTTSIYNVMISSEIYTGMMDSWIRIETKLIWKVKVIPTGGLWTAVLQYNMIDFSGLFLNFPLTKLFLTFLDWAFSGGFLNCTTTFPQIWDLLLLTKPC